MERSPVSWLANYIRSHISVAGPYKVKVIFESIPPPASAHPMLNQLSRYKNPSGNHIHTVPTPTKYPSFRLVQNRPRPYLGTPDPSKPTHRHRVHGSYPYAYTPSRLLVLIPPNGRTWLDPTQKYKLAANTTDKRSGHYTFGVTSILF